MWEIRPNKQKEKLPTITLKSKFSVKQRYHANSSFSSYSLNFMLCIKFSTHGDFECIWWPIVQAVTDINSLILRNDQSPLPPMNLQLPIRTGNHISHLHPPYQMFTTTINYIKESIHRFHPPSSFLCACKSMNMWSITELIKYILLWPTLAWDYSMKSNGESFITQNARSCLVWICFRK